LPFEAIRGSEKIVGWRGFRLSAAPLFEPGDRLVDARLQQIHEADPSISPPYVRIAGAESDGLLGKRYGLLIRASGQVLAHAQFDYGVGIVAIGCQRDLEFGNGFLAPACETQQSAFNEVRVWVARRGRQSLCQQLFDALQI